MAIQYSRKNLLSDLTLLIVVGLMGFGLYHFLMRPLSRAWKSHYYRNQPPIAVGTPIDDSWSVQNLTGSETIQISNLKGKVIFLNFWASWCAPCRMELPSIENLYQQYKNTDVVFLCVSGESWAQVQYFAQKQKIQIPLYVVEKFPSFFKVKLLPTTYIVARSGKIALSTTSPSYWDKKGVTDFLDSLLAEKAQ